jgi:hypothetical protein
MDHCACQCQLPGYGCIGRFPPISGHEPPRGMARILQKGQKKERAVPGKTGALFKEEKGESDPIRWPSVKIQYSRLFDGSQWEYGPIGSRACPRHLIGHGPEAEDGLVPWDEDAWGGQRRGSCTDGTRGRARRPRQDWRALQGGERRKHQGVHLPPFQLPV